MLTTTALGQQPWTSLNPNPIYASNNLVRFADTNDQSARFYKVVKLDTDPPEVWRAAPGDGAIAVGRQSPLKVYLQDETAIDPTSIALTVGTNPPATLADGRLAYANGMLTYTPGTNEFLGNYAATVSCALAVSDTLGQRGTNAWSFGLELETVLADNVVLIGSPPGFAAKTAALASSSGLTLVSTNGATFVFSYTGASSGLTNGQVLVSTDPAHAYKRKIISLADDPGNQTVTVVTEQASLAECVQQGSIRLTGDFADLTGGGAGFSSIGATISLDGTELFDNGTIRVEVVSGQISFTPDFTVSGEFDSGRLVSFDSEISGTVGLDMTLRGSFQVTGDWDGTKPLITPIRKVNVLAWIAVIPVWTEAVMEFDIGYEAQAEAFGEATAGFTSSRTMTFGARLRDGNWSMFRDESSSFVPVPPSWSINGAAKVAVYVEPKLTVYLESLAGLSANLKPYLEADGKACVVPGQAGVDFSLYAGLSSTLAVDVRGWDEDWGTLPSWELFNLRKQIYHKNLTTPTGPPPNVLPGMVWIPCGRFTMGSPESEPARYSNETQHEVTISRGFWMGKYEVTQAEYQAVMGSNPSYFQGANLPVETVSWHDAVAYCAALTAREQAAGRLPAGYVYRLPTEAQWEYACRAGTTTPFHYGNALRSGMANFDGRYEYPPCGSDYYGCYNPGGTYLGRTTSVGSYAPNAWGFYDMHGNVWEWCADWYGAYRCGARDGSCGACHGLAPRGPRRLLALPRQVLPVSGSRPRLPGLLVRQLGFRVVLVPGQP